MKYRVRLSRYSVPCGKGCIENEIVYHNILQKRFGFFWISIDKERIPSHVMFSMKSIGLDTTNWKSKFASYK